MNEFCIFVEIIVNIKNKLITIKKNCVKERNIYIPMLIACFQLQNDEIIPIKNNY